MILNIYESTKFDHWTWLHVSSEASGPPAETLIKKYRYKKKLLLRLNTSF